MTTLEELRTLVAEVVMGWGKGAFHFVAGKKTQRWFDDGGSFVADGFDPLSSWGDAGRVIERMEGLGWDLSVTRYNGPYCVTFSRAVGAFPGVTADDLKQTISLAALRALGVEVE